MCGLAGFVGSGNATILEGMVATLHHRGPDLQAVSFRDGVGLGHARLKIIDLNENANQPFFNKDKTRAIIFNGEIYNYRELRAELQKSHDFVFTTQSDTEVLLYLYEALGEKMFDKINGMFSFAIYDFTQSLLFMARDRMGKKPLYYYHEGDTLVFASEIKALLKHPVVKKELDLDALNEYLTLEYVPSPSSIFKGIKKLEPGTILTFKDKTVRHSVFWNVRFGKLSLTYEEAQERLDQLLDAAVRDRLVSDVPLGVFLSGGLDSSTIAYYAQKNSPTKVNTFSIGFDDKSYDESDYAHQVSKHLGTQHNLAWFTETDILDILQDVFSKMDEPLADPSLLPTHLLSKFARQHVTVALGGDGSDELLAGYPTFHAGYLAPVFSKMPNPVRKIFGTIANWIPTSDKNMSLDFKTKQFLKGFEEEERYTHSLWLGTFTPREKQSLLSEEVKEKTMHRPGLQAIDRYLHDVGDEKPFNQLLYLYFKTYLLEDILVKVDRASMFASLEVRAPFLDYRVVEFINALPANFKLRNLRSKAILKSLMKGKLPDEIIDRPKKGFGIPLSRWLRHELKPLCEDLLSEKSLSAHGLFNPGYVEKIKNQHFSGKINHRKPLWTLMVFQMWYKNFCEKS